MSDLHESIKEMIVEVLNLEDISPSEIENDAPLFGEGFGLDSIDALELIVEIEKRFSVKIESAEVAGTALASVATIAEYVTTQHG